MAVSDGISPPRRIGLTMPRRRLLTHAVIFLVLVGLWEIGSRAGWLDPLFYPTPRPIFCDPSG